MLVELSALIKAKEFFSSNSAFSNDIKDANQQKNNVDSFVNTTRVSGEAWDVVKSNLNNFSLALEKRASVAQNMMDTITGVLDRLIDFLQTDDGNGVYYSLDLSQMEKIEKEIEKMNNSIRRLEEYRDSLFKTEMIVKKETSETTTRSVPDTEARAKVQVTIDDTEKIKSELQKYLNKMKDFQIKYEKEMGNIQGLDGELSDFKSTVDNLNPGSSLT